MENEEFKQDLLKAIKESAKKTEQNILVKVNESIKESAEQTEQNILVAVNAFADKTEQRFDKIESDVSELKHDVSELKTEVTEIRSKMVTKEYLDDKLADFRCERTVSLRKENEKVEKIVNTLRDENVFSEKQRDEILAMEPFAKHSI